MSVGVFIYADEVYSCYGFYTYMLIGSWEKPVLILVSDILEFLNREVSWKYFWDSIFVFVGGGGGGGVGRFQLVLYNWL